MKIIVITGGCGLLGWEFANSLAIEKNKIFILDNSTKKIRFRKKNNKKKKYFFL